MILHDSTTTVTTHDILRCTRIYLNLRIQVKSPTDNILKNNYNKQKHELNSKLSTLNDEKINTKLRNTQCMSSQYNDDTNIIEIMYSRLGLI